MALRVGIIGCGVIGHAHLEHFTKDERVRLEAVADLIEERVAGAASEFAPAKTYRRGAELIDDANVEAVVLATPAESRYDLAPRVLRAGKHLLIEKPVARNLGEVDEYIKLAQPGRVVAVASSRFRFTATYAALRGALSRSGLAPIRQIIHEGLRPIPEPPTDPPPPWRVSHVKNGGGIMSNWGCYDLDYLLSLLPAEDHPVEVTASIRGIPREISRWVAPGSDAETFVSVMIRFVSGATVHLNRGEFLPLASGRNETLILGDSATVTAPMVSLDDPVTLTRYDPKGSATESIGPAGKRYGSFHQGMIQDFVTAILEQREPATGLARARVIQSITDAIYRSAKEQRSISL